MLNTDNTIFTLPESETITDDVLVSENIEQTLSNKKFKDNDNNEYTIDDIPKLNTANTFTATLSAPAITLNGNDINNVFASQVHTHSSADISNWATATENFAKLNTPNTFTANQTINSILKANNFKGFSMPETWDDTKSLSENLNMGGFKLLSPCYRTIANFPDSMNSAVFLGTGGARSFILTCSKTYTADDIRVYFNGVGDQQDFNYTDKNKYSRLLTHRNFNALIPNVAYTNAENTFTAKQNISTTTDHDYTEPFRVWAPNLTSDHGVLLKFGRTNDRGNCCYIEYHWYGSDNINNYFGIGFYSYDKLYRFYRDRAEFNNAVKAADFIKWSDIRKKENIKELNETDENPIDKIKVYSFNLINDENKRKRYGVIAQELQEIMPELVYDDNSENHYLSVDYIGLIPHLINTIKHQQKIINDMNDRLKRLETQL